MENKTTHTPGPWVIRKVSKGGMSDCADWYAVGPQIDGAVHFVTKECYLQDACLIAAAPELLDALKYVIRELALDDKSHALIRAAIAKAEGK